MIRFEIRDAAVSAAKAYCHPTVEPRHVYFALARRFRSHPEAAVLLEAARRALEPRGHSYDAPVLTDAAAALVATIGSERDAINVLLQGFGPGRDDSSDAGAAAQLHESYGAASATRAASAPAKGSPTETTAGILAELDGLVGLAAVKAQVRRAIAVVQANTERTKAGLRAVNPSLHLVFTGPPGTGKTTVARIVARLYAATGALPGSNFTEVSRADLVAGYVGQTAIKTREVVERTRPGVLFIDEAYALTPRGNVDFGGEAIATLVKAMEDYRDDFAVVVAGYGDEMAEFVESNPGLRSRFQTFIDFPDYSADELTDIFAQLARENAIELTPGVRARAGEIFRQIATQRHFGNARAARSLFEQAYALMAARAAEDGVLTLDELTTFTIRDLDVDLDATPPERRRIGFSRAEPPPPNC